MAEPVSYTDVLKNDSGFSFTGNMARFSRHPEMVDGYRAITDENVLKNDFTSMWEAVKVSSEESGNEIYSKIKHYIDEIGNIDTCGLSALENYAKILSVDTDVLVGKNFPKEIKNLIEVFSVNTAYLYNKATDGSESSLTLKNTILDSTTIEKFLSSFKSREDYRNMVRDVFYNTLLDFINLKVGCFDDSKVLNANTEIWKTDISRFKNRIWEYDVVSEESIFKLKESLGVNKSFTEKIYADDVISGKKKIEDFSDVEKTVIIAEIESRQSRYGNAAQLKYYFMRLYKVMEYFRFISLTNSKVYELSKYDISETKYSINDASESGSLIISDYGDYKINTDLIFNVSKWLSDYCVDIINLRNKLKTQCQRNMMCGTKKLLIDLIRELILENIDKDTWNKFKNTTIYAAGLNKNFKVKLVEYIDNTEYFNVENPTDAVSAADAGLAQRYWENETGANKALSREEILSFYNKLSDDAKIFQSNDAELDGNANNLYEFLSALFECGATSNVNSDVTDDGQSFTTTGGSDIQLTSTSSLSGDALDAFKKYSGDASIGETPWINAKNTFHPSFQIHPFLNGFEEYTSAYTGIMNLVNSFSDDITTSIERLSDRIDSLGNTINFWYNWNEDFTGYSSNFEKGGSDSDIKKNQDGPFNFDALNEFISLPDEYILNILSDSNEYYLDASTRKPILNDIEKKLEISRLKKFQRNISELTEKSISKYGKDKNGNIFILYKDSAEKDNKNYLGDVWVRLRNHPIAFPLFDITDSQDVYTSISCISESNNQKLNDILKLVVNRFKETYGVHGTDSRFVIANNLSISFGTCVKSAYVTKDSEGKPSHPSLVPSSVEDFEFDTHSLKVVECDYSMMKAFFDRCYSEYGDKLVDISKIADIDELKSEYSNISALSATDYFVDNITNETVYAMMSVSGYNISTGEYFDVGNDYGKVIDKPSDSYFKATYKNNTLEIRPAQSTQRYVTFAAYDDIPESDANITFFYTNESGVVHPCSMHTIKLRSVYTMTAKKLTASIAEDGSANFGELTSTTTETVTESSNNIVDGAVVMENFDSYTYSFFNPITKSASGYKYTPEDSDSKKIVFVGGNNPFYVFDDTDENDVHYTYLIKATRVKRADERDSFLYTDNNLYREVVADGEAGYEMNYFKFSDCEFSTPADSKDLFDTTRQFYKKDTPYKFYQPYTDITNPTTDISQISSGSASGCVTFTNGTSGETKFYYNLIPTTHHGEEMELKSKTIKTRIFKDVVTTNLVRFGGGFSFISDNATDYPIELTFMNSNSQYNKASYSTMYGENDFKKFFDMGFSYDQKRMYLSYRNGSEEFDDSGMLLVDVSESTDSDFTHHLSLSRETSHNIEATEPSMLNSHELMSENAIPLMYEVCPNTTLSGCNQFVSYNSVDKIFEMDSASKISAFRELVGFKNSDFWYASATEFAALSGKILAEDPDAFTTKYTSTGEVEKATSFYTISGNPRGVYGNEEGYFVTDSIERMFKESDSNTYAASGNCEYAYVNITDDEIVGILDAMSKEIDVRKYADSLKTVHIGDCVSKKGIFSVYGKYNDSTGMISMCIYLFTNGDVSTNNFELKLKFAPYDFGVSNKLGRYSFKTVCTEDRLYVAFTSKTPSDDFVITNGINAGVSGIGSTTFGKIKETVGDSIITILSFNIDDVESIEEVSDECRYIFKNGTIGYIPQFGGLDGKNMLFTNSGLSADTRFPFESQFDVLSGDAAVKLYGSFNREISTDNSNTVSFSKFIDVSRTDGTVDGILVDSTNKYGYYVPTISDDGNITRFGNIGDRSIYDVSNTSSKYKLIADGVDASTSIGAVVCDGGSAVVRRLPILNNSTYVFSTDFKSFDETNEKIYSLHTSGNKVSVLSVKDVGHNVFDSGFVDFDNTRKMTLAQVEHAFDEGNYGTQHSAMSDVACVCTHTTITETVEEEGGTYSFIEHDAVVLSYFGAYGNEKAVQTNVYDSEDTPEYVKAIDITKRVIPFTCGNVPYVSVYSGKDGARDIYLIRRVLEDGSFDIENTISFDVMTDHHLVTEFVDTKVSNDKVVYTDSLRAYLVSFDFENNVCSIKYTKTFDELVSSGKIDGSNESLDKFTIVGGHGYNFMHYAYHSDELELGGLLYVRRDTPDSVGIEASFDVDGVKNISKIVSANSIVLVEEIYNGFTRIHRSEDDGRTFKIVEHISNSGTKVLGCFNKRFVIQYKNGVVATSENGNEWTNCDTLIYSNWVAFNAKGRSYAFCSKLSDEAVASENVNSCAVYVESQIELDDIYDGIVIDENGTVAAYSGKDGTSPMKISVIDVSSGDVTKRELSSVRGTRFNGCREYHGSLFFAPDGGTLALKVNNVFNESFDGTFKFIDLSNSVGADSDRFGGFAIVGNSLIMYPSSGDKVLIFNEAAEKFYNYVTFGENCLFVDADEVLYGDNKTVIFTNKSSVKNQIGWTVLTSVDRNDFALVEIDEGYPILVTRVYNYSNATHEFTFSLLNDKAKGRVTISTYPNEVVEEFKDLYTESTSKSCCYTVGNKAITYQFSTVDNTAKYVIVKNVAIEDEIFDVSDYLNVTYYFDRTNRRNAWFDYTSDVKNRYSVYRGFSDENELTADDIYQKDIPIQQSKGKLNIGLFNTFAFTNTVSLSGNFNTLAVSSGTLDIVKNSNLRFTDKTKIVNADSLFKDCKNARFDSDMLVNNKVMTRTTSMFENCENALLPSVDMSDSGVVDANAMFRNCGSASLNTVKLPNTMKTVAEMFKNCSSANLYEVELPYGDGVSSDYTSINGIFDGCVNATLGGVRISPTVRSTYCAFKNCKKAGLDTITGIGNSENCREMFYGCESATFDGFTFGVPSKKTDELDFSYMFFNCYGMNPKNLAFENASPYVKTADYMFSGIGIANTDILNERLYKFMKLKDATGMFSGANLSLAGTCFQFYGKDGYIDIDTGTMRSCTVSSLEGFFGNNTYLSSNAPRIILSDDDVLTLDSVDSAIDKPLKGHYSTYLGSYDNGITMFRGLYKNTTLSVADIRGICNNIDMLDMFSEKYSIGVQNFESMFEGCKNLTEIKGYIPPYAVSLRAMFKDCPKLSVDISELFRLHSKDFESTYDTKKAFVTDEDGNDVENPFYNLLDISYMFDGCESVYTTDDRFDLAKIADKVVVAHENKGDAVKEKDLENAFKLNMPIAMKDNISALPTAIYDTSEVSKNGLAIHYATTDELMKKFSPSSNYTKWLFKSGFYRYCGQLPADLNKHMSVIYYPTIGVDGEIIKLEPRHGKIAGLSPVGFQANYTERTYYVGYWWWYGWHYGWWWGWDIWGHVVTEYDYWSFDYNDVYAAEINDTAENTKDYKFIGEYTLIHNWRVAHWYRVWWWGWWWWWNYAVYYTYHSEYFQMPVALFDGSGVEIEPL